MEKSTRVKQLNSLAKSSWETTKLWGKWWLALTLLGAWGCGHPLQETSLQNAQQIAPLLLLCLAFDLILWLWPDLTLQLLGRLNVVFTRIAATRVFGILRSIVAKFPAPPARLEAWSAQACVTLVAICGLFGLILSASSGWKAILMGLPLSLVIALIFWVLMSWTDDLQKRATTRARSLWGVCQLLFVLGAGWLGFISVLLWFVGKYA